MRAYARMRTCAGAAIFVHSGAEGALKMCVQVRVYNTFLVRTCADVSGHVPHVHYSYKMNTNLLKKFGKFFLKKCAGAGAHAGAKTGVRCACGCTLKV